MAIDWTRYFRQCGKELYIIIQYSLMLTIITSALEFLELDNELLITAIQLTMFFAIAINEDSETVELYWPDLVTRLTVTFLASKLTRTELLYSRQKYSSGNLLSNYNKDEDLPSLIYHSFRLEHDKNLNMISSSRMFLIVAITIAYVLPGVLFASRVGIHIISSSLVNWYR